MTSPFTKGGWIATQSKTARNDILVETYAAAQTKRILLSHYLFSKVLTTFLFYEIIFFKSIKRIFLLFEASFFRVLVKPLFENKMK